MLQISSGEVYTNTIRGHEWFGLVPAVRAAHEKAEVRLLPSHLRADEGQDTHLVREALPQLLQKSALLNWAEQGIERINQKPDCGALLIGSLLLWDLQPDTTSEPWSLSGWSVCNNYPKNKTCANLQQG